MSFVDVLRREQAPALQGWDKSVLPTNTAIVGDDALIVPHHIGRVGSGGSMRTSTPTGKMKPLPSAVNKPDPVTAKSQSQTAAIISACAHIQIRRSHPAAMGGGL
ncbi:MAG: hypothetical protein FWD58_00765 [Firmicutes bacterium]|nr:hypothetical protein [Bacillota bacterium]